MRTHEHNRTVAKRIQELAAEARGILEDREERQVGRIKVLLERYYRSRDEGVKREIEEANGLYPFVFARAFQELKADRPPAPEAPARAEAAIVEELLTPPAEAETVYPLEDSWREQVLEIERVAGELERDLAVLKERGAAEDILQATCAKLLARARESLGRRDTSADFAARYLEMTRKSLVTAYRQVRARVTRGGGA